MKYVLSLQDEIVFPCEKIGKTWMKIQYYRLFIHPIEFILSCENHIQKHLQDNK
jgi:hypothetical protein